MKQEIIIYRINLEEHKFMPFIEGGLYCGEPNNGDFTPEQVDIVQLLSNGGQDEYIAVIQGDSMVDMGYHPGDICIVNRDMKPSEGNVVVAYIDGDFTMKIYHEDLENHEIVLFPANKNYKTIEIDTTTENFKVWGVVRRCIKNTTGGLTIIKARMKQESISKQPPVSIENVKNALIRLFNENIISNGKHWYAIYRVLNKYCGYPEKMTEFCHAIQNLDMEEMPYPCVYRNWRNVGAELRNILPQNLDLWNDYKNKVDEKTLQYIIIVEKLKEFLNLR